MPDRAAERPRGYDARERHLLAAAFGRGERLVCPRCGATLSVQDVAAQPGVPYVRRRVLVVCPQCHASAALDRPPAR